MNLDTRTEWVVSKGRGEDTLLDNMEDLFRLHRQKYYYGGFLLLKLVKDVEGHQIKLAKGMPEYQRVYAELRGSFFHYWPAEGCSVDDEAVESLKHTKANLLDLCQMILGGADKRKRRRDIQRLDFNIIHGLGGMDLFEARAPNSTAFEEWINGFARAQREMALLQMHWTITQIDSRLKGVANCFLPEPARLQVGWTGSNGRWVDCLVMPVAKDKGKDRRVYLFTLSDKKKSRRMAKLKSITAVYALRPNEEPSSLHFAIESDGQLCKEYSKKKNQQSKISPVTLFKVDTPSLQMQWVQALCGFLQLSLSKSLLKPPLDASRMRASASSTATTSLTSDPAPYHHTPTQNSQKHLRSADLLSPPSRAQGGMCTANSIDNRNDSERNFPSSRGKPWEFPTTRRQEAAKDPQPCFTYPPQTYLGVPMMIPPYAMPNTGWQFPYSPNIPYGYYNNNIVSQHQQYLRRPPFQ